MYVGIVKRFHLIWSILDKVVAVYVAITYLAVLDIQSFLTSKVFSKNGSTFD